jgi:hypothetical protein
MALTVHKSPEEALGVWPEWVSLAEIARHFSPGFDPHLKHQLLPADCIPEIIERLPPPFPGVLPRLFVLSAWPMAGHLRITLAVRRNALPDVHTWYWAVESAERIDGNAMQVLEASHEHQPDDAHAGAADREP